MRPKKPRNPGPFKGKRKIIPIRQSEKELSFNEKVEKFGEYMNDPEQHNKIFTELEFTYVDDGCEGDCDNCGTKDEWTVYPVVQKFEQETKKKKPNNVVPLKKK